MKKNIFSVLIVLFCFSCTSISSNLVDHRYVVETLVKPVGLDLNYVTTINILLNDSIYNEFLPDVYYKKTDKLIDLSSDYDLSNDINVDFSINANQDSTIDVTIDISTKDESQSVKLSIFSKEEIARKRALNRKKIQVFQYALCLKEYILNFYHNRGLQEPKVSIITKPRHFFGHELVISINELDINLEQCWNEVQREIDLTNDMIVCYHNNVDFTRLVNVRFSGALLRFEEAKFECDLTNDVNYQINSSNCIERTYKTMDKVATGQRFLPSIESFANKNIRQIDKKMLYKGTIEKIFRKTFGQALIPISKDIVYFKFGKGEQFTHAQSCLKLGRYDEALSVWLDIYNDEGNPTFARGVAAYNIAMCKTLQRDYEAADEFFAISEDLRADGLQNLERF